MLPEERTISFIPTRADLLAFNLRALIRNRLVIGFVCIVFLFVVITDTTYQQNPPVSFTVRFVAGIIAGVFVIVVSAIAAFLFAALTVWTGKFKNVLIQQTTTITDEGLLSSSLIGEGLIRWAGIHKVHSTPKLLIIYTNETTARIIPKRFFSSKEAASAFEHEIRARMKSS